MSNRHGRSSTQVRAQRASWQQGTELCVFEHDYTAGVVVAMSEVKMVTVPEGTAYPRPIFVEDQHAQTLMDDLWHCGFRPTEGGQSVGALSATKEHLDDLRKIVERLMGVLFKSEDGHGKK